MTVQPLVFTLEDPVFRALLDLSPVAIGISRQGTMIYANPVYLSLHGYAKGCDIMGWAIADFVAPSERAELERRVSRQDRSSMVIEKFETLGVRKDGTELDLEVTMVPIPFKDGPASLVFLVDTSSQKAKDDTLWEQDARFKVIFMTASVGMALVAMDGTPILVNTALTEMLGYSEAEFQKMTFSQFTHPEDIQKDMKLFKEILGGKRNAYNIEKRFIRKDGLAFPCHLTVSVVKSPSGKPHYVVGVVEQTSDRVAKLAV